MLGGHWFFPAALFLSLDKKPSKYPCIALTSLAATCTKDRIMPSRPELAAWVPAAAAGGGVASGAAAATCGVCVVWIRGGTG